MELANVRFIIVNMKRRFINKKPKMGTKIASSVGTAQLESVCSEVNHQGANMQPAMYRHNYIRGLQSYKSITS